MSRNVWVLAGVWASLLRLAVGGGVLVLGASWFAAQPAQAQAQVEITATVYMMRHALAPGFGDPSNIRLGDCATQRNLNDQGRAQAVKAGEWLRAQGLDAPMLLASPWCRTLETAELLGLGDVRATAALSSFFQQGSSSDTTRKLQLELKAALQEQPPRDVALVTHQVNIQAFTGSGVASGEILVLTVSPNGEFVAVRQRHVP
ncbi:acid phosphatase [Betaproteobacteria bacterium MOLA814]|nr:acid phosphatase [Betaproteobacteria bacterium MOLA814]